jgi:hypothetical protein
MFVSPSPAWRRAASALLLAGAAGAALAGADARVFPVAGVFWTDNNSAIDQRFLRAQDAPRLAQQVKAALDAAFAGRTGVLTRQTAGSTFAVSFHLTRMASYRADKADRNVELRTPVTGSIYFTNVVTGEILYTATSTNAAVALLARQALQGDGMQREEDKLYAASLAQLIAQLSKQAGQEFQPRAVEASVNGNSNGLLLLSAGYKQGLQSGDSLEDDQGNLIKVAYAGADYAAAQVVLADDVRNGAVFRKFVVGKIDGRLRPRAAVVAGQVPEGFSSEYLTQLFSEELGAKAPLTMVQVNPGFSQLLQSVVQQADLSNSSTAQRDTPDLLIRLRIGDPIQYETATNLGFQTTRGVAAEAYAELIDTSGRVLFAASGRDSQKISVTNGLDLAPAARREIAIKNALLTLAQNMGGMAEARPESAKVARAGADGVYVSTPGQVYAAKAPGYVLHPTKFTVSGKPVTLLFPLAEAVAEQRAGDDTRLGNLLPLTRDKSAVAPGDVFEVLRLGATPKSAALFSLCPDSENLGSVATPQFDNLVSVALAQAMPGQYYAAEVRKLADDTISVRNGFNSNLQWDIPAVHTCVQPVQRVDVVAEECADSCQKATTARYTLRVRTDNVVGAKLGLESKFRSSGYQKSSNPADVMHLLQLDVIDEAQKLLSGLATKLVLPSN